MIRQLGLMSALFYASTLTAASSDFSDYLYPISLQGHETSDPLRKRYEGTCDKIRSFYNSGDVSDWSKVSGEVYDLLRIGDEIAPRFFQEKYSEYLVRSYPSFRASVEASAEASHLAQEYAYRYQTLLSTFTGKKNSRSFSSYTKYTPSQYIKDEAEKRLHDAQNRAFVVGAIKKAFSDGESELTAQAYGRAAAAKVTPWSGPKPQFTGWEGSWSRAYDNRKTSSERQALNAYWDTYIVYYKENYSHERADAYGKVAQSTLLLNDANKELRELEWYEKSNNRYAEGDIRDPVGRAMYDVKTECSTAKTRLAEAEKNKEDIERIYESQQYLSNLVRMAFLEEFASHF